MTWVDLLLIVLILLLGYGGFMRGVVQEIFDLLVLGVGTAVSLRFFGPLGDWLQPMTGTTSYTAHWIAFVLLFIPVAAAIFALGLHLDQMQSEDTSIPGPLKYGAGAALGALKGLFLGWLVLVSLHHLPLLDGTTLQEMDTAPVVQAVQGLQPTFVAFVDALTPPQVSRWLVPAMDQRF